MTSKKFLTEEELVKIFKSRSANGQTSKTEMIKGIREYAEVTYPTAQKILNEHMYMFEFDFVTKVLQMCSKYYFEPIDSKTVNISIDSVNNFLDKTVLFVTVRPHPEDFLILVDTLRDNAQDGIFDDIDKITVLLEQRYGQEAKSLIEEGQILYSAYSKRSKEAFFNTQTQKPVETTQETQETDTSKMVETL
jgi:hypothetical protein